MFTFDLKRQYFPHESAAANNSLLSFPNCGLLIVNLS